MQEIEYLEQNNNKTHSFLWVFYSSKIRQKHKNVLKLINIYYTYGGVINGGNKITWR